MHHEFSGLFVIVLLFALVSGYMVVSMVPTRQSDQNQRLMSAELIDDDGDHDTGIMGPNISSNIHGYIIMLMCVVLQIPHFCITQN